MATERLAGRLFEKVTKNVDGAARKPSAQLDAADQLNAYALSIRLRRIIAFQAVMVGDGKRLEA
jgi:hypothetical protein